MQKTEALLNEKFTQEEAQKIKKALELAEKKSSEESLEQAVQELAEIRADSETITATLLLQALKKQSTTPKEAEKEFGKQTLELAEAVQKTETLQEKATQEQKTEALRKILLSLSKDLRVIIICFASKILELRESKSKQTATEASEIYAPLAHKLGMNHFKNQLEDLSFQILHPQEFKELQESIEKGREEREKQVEIVKKTLTQKLKEAGIEAEIFGRAKQLHSVWKKNRQRNKKLEEIYDLIAVRVVTNSVKECYQALGIVHELWQPIQTEFKDYIAKPKSNMYQSIHTVIIGPNQKPIEVQIRTKEMHYIAETGIAAHWRYKKEESAGRFEKKLSWLKEASEWMQNPEKAKDFLDSLKLDFFENEIFVFTPKGEVIELPEGSTPIDFAFAVHSDLGFKCEKAKANGKIVSLDYKLQNGDTVEITTSEKQQPKRQWLSFVKTSKAATKIRQALQIQITEKKPEKIKKETAIKSITIKSNEDKAIKLAKCCKPVPGDEITGFLTTKRKISVHRLDCENIEKMQNQRKVNVEWDVKGKGNFAVSIRIIAAEKPGLLSETLSVFAKANARVLSANAKTTLNNLTEGNFEIEIKNIKELEQIMQKIQNIKGVQKVERA